MTERPEARSEWLKPLEQRLPQVDGPPPLAVRAAAIGAALFTPLMVYLAVVFALDVVDFATRPVVMFVHILGYGAIAIGSAVLAIGCPYGAWQLVRTGESRYVDWIGWLIGGMLTFVLGLSIASNGFVDLALFGALAPATLGGFALPWLLRRTRSQRWLQSKRRSTRAAAS